ncbi:hypothetical protein ACFWZ2_36220 [Streptomyces sp. NPDC059002]|uniref:hypothetical protein n=1 Tax=Streptomyces sp. NPDC059002 TaxID=3346690 RepID=UPI0036A1FFE0
MPGQDGDFDALMLAITDEPVPEEALCDPDFAAAVADVTLLRERLGAVGDALAAAPAPPEERAAVPLRAPRPAGGRRRGVVLGALAATVAALVVGGLGWLAVDAGQGMGGDADSAKGAASDKQGDAGGGAADLTPEGFVACSRLIVEGTVTAVDPVPGDVQDRITLDVTRYLKPGSGARTVRFPMDRDVDPRLKKGDDVLISIPKDAAEPDNWATGKKDRDRLRAMILKAIPRSEKIRCDGGPGPGD